MNRLLLQSLTPSASDGKLMFYYRIRDKARADMFDCIERLHNMRRRHSKLGYIGPMEFEASDILGLPAVHEIGSRPAP